MTARYLVLALFATLVFYSLATSQGTRLLRHPTVSRDLIAFEYAGDLWAVSRNGGEARRLTSTPGVEYDPYFSPDGSKIAFSSTVAGNTDVYVMPTAGGDPKRLQRSIRVLIEFADGPRTDARYFFLRLGSVSRRRHIIVYGQSILKAACPSPYRCREVTRVPIRRTADGSHLKRSRCNLFLSGLRAVIGDITEAVAPIRSRS